MTGNNSDYCDAGASCSRKHCIFGWLRGFDVFYFLIGNFVFQYFEWEICVWGFKCKYSQLCENMRDD